LAKIHKAIAGKNDKSMNDQKTLLIPRLVRPGLAFVAFLFFPYGIKVVKDFVKR